PALAGAAHHRAVARCGARARGRTPAPGSSHSASQYRQSRCRLCRGAIIAWTVWGDTDRGGRTVTISDQVDALQKRAEGLKSSFDQSRHETNEQVKARLGQARADVAARQDAGEEQAEKTAGQAQSQWQAMKADAAAKMQAIQDRIDRQRD